MVKTLAASHPLVHLYQHVDDISNLVTASSPGALVTVAVRYALHFKDLCKQLLLQISEKSAVVPGSSADTTSTCMRKSMG